MRTIETTIYTFDELSDTAKKKARDWYRNGFEYPWWSEVQDSLKTFCDGFGVKVSHYEIGGRGAHISTDADNSHFRGFKLKDYTGGKNHFARDLDSLVKGINELLQAQIISTRAGVPADGLIVYHIGA